MKKRPNLKRLAKRKQDKELFTLNVEWIKTVIPFQNDLLLTDWDSVDESYDIFQKHPRFFYDFAINDQTDRFDVEKTIVDDAESENPESGDVEDSN